MLNIFKRKTTKNSETEKLLNHLFSHEYSKEIVACCDLECGYKVPEEYRVTSVKNNTIPVIKEGICDNFFISRWNFYLKNFLEPELALKNTTSTDKERKQYGTVKRFYKFFNEYIVNSNLLHLAEVAMNAHKVNSSDWKEGNIVNFWQDENGDLCVSYESGNWWHYKDLDSPFPIWW